MPGVGGGGGGVPRLQARGWYKRRLPLVTPLPGGATAHTTGLGGGAVPGGCGIYVNGGALTLPVRATVVQTRLPTPTAAVSPPSVKPPKVIRFDARRSAVVVIGQRPGRAATPPRPTPPLVVRSDRERSGLAYKTPLIAAKINVAGGVIKPWVLRRDYQQGGLVYLDKPFLKTPPAPVAGSAPKPIVVRFDRRRAGLVFLEYPPLEAPVVYLEGRTWVLFHSEARGLVWQSWLRALTWEPGMATFLTKRSGETRQYAMDFSALPELSSASLASVSSVVSNVLTVGASNVTLSSPAISSNGKMATVWISGGQSQASYQIAFTVTVAGGTVLEEFGYLLVEDE